MATPVLQLTRLTNAGRLTDRFLACQVREIFGSETPARLMMLVEIQRPWLTASQIGQALIHAFANGYIDAGDRADDVARVEAALRQVNETLVHLTQQGETDWITHLHAVFVLERSGAIHVAHTGRAAAFLSRDGSLSRITELEGPQSAASANRTFANITSGQLEPNDAFLIASAEFVKAVALDSIEGTLAEETPAEAAHRFARIVRQRQSRGAAAIIARAHDPRVLESQPLVTEPDVVYLDQEPIESFGATLAMVGRQAKKAFAVVGNSITKTGRRMDTFTRETVAPRGKTLASQGFAASKEQYQRFKTEVMPGVAKRVGPVLSSLKSKTSEQIATVTSQLTQRQDKISPHTVEAVAPLDAGLIGKDLYTVRYYTDGSRRLSQLFSRIPKVKISRFVPFFTNLTSRTNRPRLYIATAVVLLLVLVFNIYLVRSRQQQKVSDAEAATQLTDLNERFDTIKLQIAFKKSDQTTALNELLSDLTPLTKNQAVADQATTLQQQVEDALDSSTKSVRVRSPKQIATFDNPVGLLRLGSDLVTTKRDTSTIVSSPIAGELLDTRASFPEGTKVVTGTSLDNSDAIVFFTTQSSMVRMTQPGTSPTSVTLSGGNWESAVAMASFGDNLYLLDADGSQIWKHALNNGSYGSGTAFITDNTSVSDGISIAIDGSIYILSADGSIQKFTRGKRDAFSVKNLPSSISMGDPRAIWTNDDTNILYVLTKTAVFELAKDGSYLRRYASPAFADCSAFVIDPTAKQGWVLSGNTAYQFDLSA